MLFQGQEFLEGEWFRDTIPLDRDQRDKFHLRGSPHFSRTSFSSGRATFANLSPKFQAATKRNESPITR